MPIYEYRCSSCGHQKEYLRKVSDPLLTECPDCGEESLQKMVTAAGFQLKGTGWYATDFKNGSGASRPAVKSSAEKSDSAKSDSTKSDSTKSESVKSDAPAAATGKAAASPAAESQR